MPLGLGTALLGLGTALLAGLGKALLGLGTVLLGLGTVLLGLGRCATRIRAWFLAVRLGLGNGLDQEFILFDGGARVHISRP